MAGVSDNEPGRDDRYDPSSVPDGQEDDTAPLWGSGEERPSYGQEPRAQEPQAQEPYGQGYPQDHGQAAYSQGYAQEGSYSQDPYAQDPYSQGWAQHTTPMAYQSGQSGWYPPPRQAGARLPGWVWPVVAATALVVGLVGGTVGAVLVSSVSERGGVVGTTILDDPNPVPAPLDPENGSVAAVAQALLPSTVQILTRGGGGPAGAATGSGFVMDRQGHVITNNHVVAGAAESGNIAVVDHAGRRHSATIVGRSPVYDIAVLDVDGAEDLDPAALGSSQSMNIGETVVALGSPLGLSSTVTSGIVSAIDRPVTTGDQDDASFINAVQTDAAINPGNSGGPLVNLRGEVVGVNSAIATVGGFGSRPGNIGVGFAIPMEQVKVTASQIVRTGEAQYPVIGANVNTGSRRNGAEIVDVPRGTPAADAGLEEGDIVLSVEDKPVTDGIGLIVAIRSHQPGETIALTVRREGREQTLRITLDAKVG